jgi:N-acetylglutamate synthase
MSNVRRLKLLADMQDSSTAEIRPFVVADYARALALWSTIEGLGLNESDTPEAIEAFLERNLGFSAVALIDGTMVGTVLCGHNGRAGSLHHLAVAPSCRGRGIGRGLINFAFSKLAAVNIPRCNIFVYTENEEGNRFWLNGGWNDPTTWKVLQKHVQTDA